MLPSKFESLPNEILIELFERYLNGLDIINGFALRLNARIDSLIDQCQRFRFDLSECRKDQFRLVLNQLPSYVDRLEELVLSDDNAPRQVAEFTNIFDSFEPFTKLRRLFIKSNVEAFRCSSLNTILQSLPKTSVDELTVLGELLTFDRIIYFQNLKRLTFSKPIVKISADTFPHIQYLTLMNHLYNPSQLDDILEYTPQLKYLHITITSHENRSHMPKQIVTTAPKSSLEIWIVHLDEYSVFPWDLLCRYFRAMPKLRRLQLNANESFFDASLWQELVDGILITLTHLRLYFSVAGISEEEIHNRLDLFQTPFSIAEENFQIVVRNKKFLGIERHCTHFFDQIADHCWIGPRRNGIVHRNSIRTLSLPDHSLLLVPCQIFDRLTTLIVHRLTDDLHKIMLINSIKFFQIRHLILLINESKARELESFLSLFTNLETLRLPFDILFSLSDHCSILKTKLRSLDLSDVTHSFGENVIHRIQQFSPNLTHLSINTENLRSIPMLTSLMPKLCSVRCVPPYKTSPFFKRHREWEMDMQHVSQQMNNAYCFRQQCPVLWIDHGESKENF